jgi:DNA-binding HxlR family transcriptional regulator/putative sterol carrier protein
MARRRPHRDGCAAAHTLDLVGERWALLVARELMVGPKRFTDIRAGIPDISPNVLGQRLRELAEIGVLRRRTLAPPAASQVYELTEWGYELEPILQELGRWGSRSPAMPHEGELSVCSFILAMRTMFDPKAAKGLRATYELRLGEERFRAKVRDSHFEIERGEAKDADAIIVAGDPESLAEVIFGERSLAEAELARELEVKGDKRAVGRFVGLFPLPDPVSPSEGVAA